MAHMGSFSRKAISKNMVKNTLNPCSQTLSGMEAS